MKENVRLGRIAGVAVGFNWTLLLIAGFLAVGLAGGRLPLDAPGYSRPAYAIAAGLTAVAFLGGVLAHEMSHALVARREGLKVEGIVLWFMGGYTRIGEQPRSPGAELRVSAAGPAVSLLIGIGCGAAAVIGHGLGGPRLAIAVLTWLGTINVLLAVFNMLPGTPLDGGRVLHAAVWARTGDRDRAARAAGRTGWLIGAALIGAGVLSVVVRIGGVDGVWLGVVGWFLMAASRAEEGPAAILGTLEGLKASDVMAVPGVAPGWLTVDAFLRDYASGPSRPPAFLVERWGAGLAGVVSTAALEAIPPPHRGDVRAADYALPIEQLPVFGPDRDAADLVRQMTRRNARWALVVAWERIIGVVSLDDITRQGWRPHLVAVE